MTAALEGGEWSAVRLGRTLPPGKTRYPFYRRLGGPQGRSGRTENLVPTGIRSRTVQPVVSRYTDWANLPIITLHHSLKISYSTFIILNTEQKWYIKFNKNKTTESIRTLRWGSPRHISAFWLTNLQRYPRIWSRHAASSTRKWATRYVGELKWPDRLCVCVCVCVSARQSNYCWISLAVFTGPCTVPRLIYKVHQKK